MVILVLLGHQVVNGFKNFKNCLKGFRLNIAEYQLTRCLALKMYHFQCMFDMLGATPSLDAQKEPTAILSFNILWWDSSCLQGV